MTLTQQFIIISILPLSFILMIAYTWQSEKRGRRVLIRWSFTLVAAAGWSSNILRYYGGVTFSSALVFTWGIVGTFVFSLAAIGVLVTTFSHLSVPRSHRQVAVSLSIILWLIALGMAPDIWRYKAPDIAMAGQKIRYFDVWAAVWIASWLLPVIAAWILTQQIKAKYPVSLYRNQVNYWSLVLTLFFIGGILVSVRQPGQPIWQEIGVLFVLISAFTGTVSITKAQLPDLQLAMRQILGRLSGTLILFGLTWAFLRFIVQGVTNLPTDTNPNLILTLAAALFAGFFTLIYRLVNAIMRRLFMPFQAKRESAIANYTSSVGNLPEPSQLCQFFLQIIQASMAVDDGWVFGTEDGVRGKLILRPLAGLNDLPPETADFDNDSPFTGHMRHNVSPLVQYDIDTLSDFESIPESEKLILEKWQRVLYIPLSAGNRLVGVLALGNKYSGESYDRHDFDVLRSLALQISPLLAQAQNMDSLRQINDYVFQQTQSLAQKNQHLTELSHLYAQYIQLISPDLRQPYVAISKNLHQFHDGLDENSGQKHLVDDLIQQIARLKEAVDQLITMSGQIQARDNFHFQQVHLDDIIPKALHNLRTMAEARRVHIEFEPVPSLPYVFGDEKQLREAVQHLLHNAIKFNKIGGVVQLEYGLANGHLCLHVIDSGVGIPEERLKDIWDSFANKIDNNGPIPGLGLAITRFIIKAHGGYVEAQSKYGSGSVFSIYLPMMLDA